jgi:hypothetical protein
MSAESAKVAYLAIADSGDVSRDLSGYLPKAAMSNSADTSDVSCFGATRKSYVAGLIDGKISLEGIWDPTVDGYLWGILGVEDQAFIYGPEGNTAADVKYSGVGCLTKYDIDDSLNAAIKFSGEFQIDGAVTRGVFT